MKLVDVYRVTQIGLLVCTLSVHGQQGSTNVEQRVDNILKQMTLDEKLSYIGGTGFFDIKPIPVPGLQVPINPQIFQTDGPLGCVVTPLASALHPGLRSPPLGTEVLPTMSESLWGETPGLVDILPSLGREWTFIVSRWVDETSNI